MSRKKLFIIIGGVVFLGLIFYFEPQIKNFYHQKRESEWVRCGKIDPYRYKFYPYPGYPNSYNHSSNPGYNDGGNCKVERCTVRWDRGNWQCIPKFPYALPLPVYR